MYYWDEDACKINLEEELTCMNNVRELYIGTAFFSSEGLRILNDIVNKNKLKKKSVHIYISDEFSQDKPHELLKELGKIAQVRIFFYRMFHAKVYLLKGDVTRLIYGSSNFTAGGFYKNIEFDSIEEIGQKKLNEIECFFKYCELHSTEVTDDVIKYYEDIQDEIKELKEVQKKLRKKIKGYMHQDEAMQRNDYDINDLRYKILAIHNNIYPKINKLGLNCHWNSNYVISFIEPYEYDKGKGSCIGIRYGKSRKEVDIINQWLNYNEKDEVKRFHKHGCLQFSITPTGLVICLFLAERHDAIDRTYIKEMMNELEPKITKEISKLKGHGMKWEIYNEATEEYHCFEIDYEEAESFCKFLKKYDKDGFESHLKLFYPVDDKVIFDINSISNKIIFYIMMLKPLYDTMVWRLKI